MPTVLGYATGLTVVAAFAVPILALPALVLGVTAYAISSAIVAPASRSDCADPTRSECPDTRPPMPASAAQRLTTVRTLRTLSRLSATRPALFTGRNSGPAAAPDACSHRRASRAASGPA